MGMRIEEEEAVLGKMGKKSTKGEKNETNYLEEVTDCKAAAPVGVESGFKLRENKKKKKNKKKHEVNGDIELDGFRDEAVNGKGFVKVDEDLQKEKNQKKRKERKLEFGEGVTDCTGAAPMGVENSFKLSKEDKKKKNKKKHRVGGDIVLDGIHGEAVNGKGHAEINGDRRKEKDQKEKKFKKMRKLVSGEDNDALNDKTHMEGEEKRNLQKNDGINSGNDSELKPRKDKKKRHGENRKNDGSNSISSSMEILEGENTGKEEVAKGHKSTEREYITEMKNREERAKDNKNKKRRRYEDSDVEGKKKTKDGNEVQKSREDCDVDVMEKVGKKKRKREKGKDKDDLGAGLQELLTGESGNENTSKDFVDSEGSTHSTINKTQDSEPKNVNIGNMKKANSVEKGSENPKPIGKSKKVRFSDHTEVFPSFDDPSTGKDKDQEEDLVQGKRFSRKEDEIIKEAVFNYITEHGLGEEGLNMVLHCSSHPGIKTCWKDIGTALPYRPYTSIYYRAHILFERAEKRIWTKEEYELIRKFHEEHGNNWKLLADELGKHRFHVKDTWRRIKLPNMKRGHWSQDEYQALFDLVNTDLRMKSSMEKTSKHGMLRDNICWSAISDKLSTRHVATCCRKWYGQLTSSMVTEGKWADADDYRLLEALFNLDECCIEDVDWDNLLYHRSGDVCRKRWNQMVLHIGHHGNKSFAEQVEILAKRYCPDLLEAREAWDSKPVVS